MKTMKNNKLISILLSLVLIVSSTGLLQAQQSESLKRDMEVTSNLLTTLLKTNAGNSYMRIGSEGIETSYNEGFGVVFDLKIGNIMFIQSGPFNSMGEVNAAKADIEDPEKTKVERTEAGFTVNQTFVTSLSGRVLSSSNWPENNEEQEKKTEESIKEFLIEYGAFLKDLKPEESIMVQYPFVSPVEVNREEERVVSVLRFAPGISRATKNVSIKKKDADAYRNGSISKEEALSRITVEENLPEEIASDLRVLGELMNSLYSERSSKSYFSTSNPSIVRTKGMGAVYSWAVYSGYNDTFGYRLPTLQLGQQTVNEKDRNEIVKAAYPSFVESFKENLVDYGRTIKSLDGNEKIIFSIKMTRCEGCGIPDVLKVEMDKATIEDYNQGKLSRSQAISKLKVIEN